MPKRSLVLALVSWLFSCTASPASAQVTFNKDIAPLLWQRCAGCHRPGESAPFSLVEYQDAAPRARQIAAATRSRLMPPWLAEDGFGEFANARRLSDAEIALIDQWVRQGARQGSPSDLPPRPQWSEGWQLGTPDLVVSLPAPYLLRPGDADVFRSFVLPIPLKTGVYVRGVEVRPGNRAVVHHASIALDRTRGSRRLDDADGEPGFSGGMLSQGLQSPESRAIGWTPGNVPVLEPEGMAWRLEPGADLVMQVHMLPSRTGETIQVQPSVGFFFTDTPPTRRPIDFKLGSKSIDIRPGDANYEIADSFTLPVDVDVLSVYPHAHYLAKEMRAYATPPGGGEATPLIWIKNWNFHWQDEYRYVKPVALQAGSLITMRYVYDNSAANQPDRRRPPARVAFGPQSSDEMGDLWLRFVPRNAVDAEVLARSYRENELRRDIIAGERLVAEQPREAKWHNALAMSYIQAGRYPEASVRLEEAVRLQPDYAEALNNLGHLLQLQGRPGDAIPHFRDAVRLLPQSDLVHLNLANALQETEQIEEAIVQFGIAIKLNPAAADAHNNLGVALGSIGRLEEAAAEFRKALEIQPGYTDAQENLDQVIALLKTPR